jgi:methylated-DNA-protein-cysteine methyltransferase related protein
MAKPSPHFERIKADILAIVSAMPVGSVTTYKAIGNHLDVMPRHVAYILATLQEPLWSVTPWHRVVAENGKLGAGKVAIEQRKLLIGEGHNFHSDSCVVNFQSVFLAPDQFQSDVPVQVRRT